MTGLYELATRVKKGVKLLDSKIPNWRRTIKAHRDEFDFKDGEHCVLGTLEHYNGRMRVLKARKKIKGTFAFDNATLTLGITPRDYGFDVDPRLNSPDSGCDANSKQYDALSALWKAEIGL